MRYKNSSSSVGTITQGVEGWLKQTFTNSFVFTLSASRKYLGLNEITRSFPLTVAGMFSLMFPRSLFDVMQMLFSLMSNLTKLF